MSLTHCAATDEHEQTAQFGNVFCLRARQPGGPVHAFLLPDGTLAVESAMTLAEIPQALLSRTNQALLNWQMD
ncbi:MAG: hypothetical protein RQ826_10525 [Xanthomonadales bacterium]|nr:hypothetical protein [Xanthomonadales bacterium]